MGFFSRMGRMAAIPLPRPNVQTKPISRRIREANEFGIVGAVGEVSPVEVNNCGVAFHEKGHIAAPLVGFTGSGGRVPEGHIGVFASAIAIDGEDSGALAAI
jgi:hypothetical protein